MTDLHANHIGGLIVRRYRNARAYHHVASVPMAGG